MQKLSQKQKKPNFRGQAIQEPIFPVSDAEFEGGDDGRGCFDWICLVNYGQPSHTARFIRTYFITRSTCISVT
jgi:hypothetical protein